ncbi:hypothetical protein [Pseudomonas putida]
MTDQQLLELAAKAAGVCLHPEEKLVRSYGNWGCDTTCTACKKDPSEAAWDPLGSDGDALRLAMKLGICIQFIPQCDTVQVYQERDFTAEPFNVHVAGLGDIETRRVITQAAAEIGKALQEKH